MPNMHPTQKPSDFSNPTLPSTDKIKLKTELPSGWDIERVQRILEYYDSHPQNSVKNHDLYGPQRTEQNLIEVPEELIPAVLEMIEKYKAA